MTTDEKKKVSQWFCDRVFRQLRQTAAVDVNQIAAAVDAIDAWTNGLPSEHGNLGGATNTQAILAHISQDFRDGTTDVQQGILIAGIALAKAGVL